MPAKLNVNREAVKTLAIAIGVRAAARQMGLAEPTVQAWSDRYNWFAPTPLAPHLRGTATIATKSPSSALATTLSEYGDRSKLALVKASMRGAEHLADAKPDRLVKDHQALRSFAGVAATVLGWQSDQASNSFTLNVLNLGAADIDINKS